MPMNHRILRPLARPLLLDAVPGAAAAYSLRQLSNAYTGPVVTVRRSSDNAEADFKASEIDDGTLASFVGGGNDGLVKTWFDQSGNGRDASQATSANQPKIVSSGSLVTEGGKAALEFDGTNDFMRSDLVSTNQQYSTFFVYKHTALFGGTERILSLNGNLSATSAAEVAGQISSNNIVVLQDGVAVGSPAATLTIGQKYLLYFSVGIGSTPLNLFIDGQPTASSSTSTSPAGSGSLLNIFARGDGVANAGGLAQELIIYPFDQSANRQRTEGDIAWYY